MMSARAIRRRTMSSASGSVCRHPDTITAKEGCPAILEIPHQRGQDRAEGIAVRHDQDDAKLLVVYDSPAEARAPKGQTYVDADLFALPA